MDGTLIEAIAQQVAEPRSVDDGGRSRIFIPAGWQELPRKRALAKAVEVSTLTGFVDFAKDHGRDEDEGLTVHVVDPTEVRLLGELESEEEDFRRQTYCVASIKGLAGAGAVMFGQFTDAEVFFINLQSQFVKIGHREELLKLISGIKESTVRENTDDGVSQSVVARKGVALVAEQRVPNPVTLAPYRTFREIEQPESDFILRMQSGGGDKPRMALFEADGGAWKLEAIKRIAAFLRAQLLDWTVVA